MVFSGGVPHPLRCLNALMTGQVSVQSQQQVAIVYIDFAKSFNVVSHDKNFA